MNGNRKIVNKFGKDRATAERMFSDVSKFALGEMVVVNDSKLPAILIKDNNMNTYEIHGVSVKKDAGKLSVDYSKLSVIALKGLDILYSEIQMIKKHLNL